MEPFVIDRAHPPSCVEYRDGGRALTLRPWRHEDIDAFLVAARESADSLKPYMPWAHAALTRESQYDLFARFQASYHAGAEYLLGVFAEDGEILGGVGLHPRVPLNPNGLEVGYWCHGAHVGNGWTTLAVKLVTLLAFERFGCERLQLIHVEGNVGSRRVAEKSGFRHEATLRGMSARATDALRAGGYIGDGAHRLYGMLPDDYAALPWLAELRACTTLVDALGGRQ
jgi:RimJ/RimL family protein N-acetyltransferase